jgi:type IV pilus assembly protein PilN
MAHINLLPWRETLRRQRKREFGFMVVGGVVIAGLLIGYWYWFNEGRIDNQRKRNAYLQAEIAKVDIKIKEIKKLEKTRQQLIARMKVIQNLQASRPQVTQMGQSGKNVTMVGRAQSNARVSAYMRNIEQSPWLADPKLKIIETKNNKGGEGSEFSLSAKQVVPKEGGKP